MAHNLSTYTDADGIERHCMMSYRASPWHGLGQRIDQPVGSHDAIRLAGLDWTVTKKPLYTADLDAVPDHVAVQRSDTKAVLGVVGSAWEPCQNTELFNVLDGLAGAGPIIYETAGALGDGETVWVLAHLPDLAIRLGEDESRTYLLASTGHAGNRVVTIAPTCIRIVCANTLRLADADIARRTGRPQLEAGFRIRHTSGLRMALADVTAAYAATRRAHATTVAVYEHLARVPMTEAMIQACFDRVFRREAAASEVDRAAAMTKAREERLRTILTSPTCTVPGTKESAYALLQAVIEYVDHERPTRTREGQVTATQRFASAHWGSGAQVKADAFATVLDLAGV